MSKKNQSIYLDQLEFDEKLNSSWMAFFIDRMRLTWLVIIIIIIAWYLGLSKLPLESMPEVDIGMAYVVTVLPGASPESVEDLVTKKIEKYISQIQEIDTMTSTSMNGSSMILLQLISGVDTSQVLNDIKEKVDLAKPELPQDVIEPIVKEVSFDDMPIWTFAISGDYDDFELYDYAKIIRDEIEKHPLVQEVTISGWKQKQYWVILDPTKLAQYDISISQVNSAISSANITLPIWSIEIGDYKHTLNVDARFHTLEELKNIVVTKLWDTGIVKLEDIARVEEVSKKVTSISRLSVWWATPFNAITLWVVKSKWGSIVDLVDDGNHILSQLKSTHMIPEDIQIQTIVDNAEMIKTDLSHLIRDGILTIIIVFIALWLIIWLKEALVAGTAVPIVFLITFAVMQAYGQTLNFLSMFALILSLWLLVDDAIVVISAINQYKKSWKFTTRQAALLVLKDFRWVLTTTTLTVVFIFGSMLFMTGIMGSFIFSIPFVVSVILIASLIVALTLNPALSVMISGRDSKFDPDDVPSNKTSFIKRILNYWIIPMNKIENAYGVQLTQLIEKPKTRRRFLFLLVCLFLFSLALPVMGILKTEFFPKTDSDNFTINIELEPGTKLQTTSDIISQIEEVLFWESEIASFATSIWSIADDSWGGGVSEHYANISVKLNSKDQGRKEKSYDIATRLREKFSGFQYGTISMLEESSGPGNSAAFEIKVAWEDFEVLDKIAKDVQDVLVTIPGSTDIATSRKPLPFEFQLALDPVRLALYDISTPQVATFLRNIIDGSTATKVYIWDEEIEVRTLYEPQNTDSFDKIKDITLKNNRWQDIPLRDLITQEFQPSVFSITRVDGERVVTITAGAKSGYSGQQIQMEFDAKMVDYVLPDGYKFILWGETEENLKSIMSLWTSMMFWLLLIVWLLVLLYDSYKQAVLVMITIPLSLIGVFIGLTLTGQSLTFPGMIWLVALFGIVVRNGIILYDKINQNLDEKIPFVDAIIDAWTSRLEPVLLTSICTVLGMIPLTFSNPTWTGLGLSIMFGLSTSTFFTLLALPALYYIFFRKKYPKRSLSHNK